MHDLKPAEQPTIYFFGVTTGQSSINRIFPLWARELGLHDACLVGLDFPLQDAPERYRAAVEFIKHDPLSRGALVTSHKLDVVRAAGELFDGFDEFGTIMSEVSCIYKRDGRLYGAAKDAVTSRLALSSFVPDRHWATPGREALLLGAGGASVACMWTLAHPDRGPHRPARIVVTDIDSNRLEHLRAIHGRIESAPPLEDRLVEPGAPADEILARMKPDSLIVNATGMGKDRPGSPIGDRADWPERARVWELNYRGERRFMHQAREQGLEVEDGWNYFLYGWTGVIADVFDIEIPASGPLFETLSEIGTASR
ncbi:MAG: shikimate dehydrogenase [Verrucomicrobiota bacterium]